MTNVSTERLQPCPFCGGTEIHMSALNDEDDRRIWVREVECDTCQLKMRDWACWPMGPFDRQQLSDNVGLSLTKMWNTRALSSREAEGGRVKPMEWEGCVADTELGAYTVSEDSEDLWHWTYHSYPYGVQDDRDHETEAEAKAAAQADYETRILSALTPAPRADGEATTIYIAADHTGCIYECEDRDLAIAIAQANEASVKALADGEAVAWNDAPSAPKDGTLLRLLVVPSEYEHTSFHDSETPYETIGFNNLKDTGEDHWQFAGWDWSHDCITQGYGEVIGWLPFADTHPTPARGITEGQVEAAARDVLAERRRQVEAEGWTPAHDDAHDKGELSAAAGVYALAAASHDYRWVLRGSPVNDYMAAVLKLWPFEWSWFKPKSRRQDKVRAAALLLADIEREDRAALKAAQEATNAE